MILPCPSSSNAFSCDKSNYCFLNNSNNNKTKKTLFGKLEERKTHSPSSEDLEKASTYVSICPKPPCWAWKSPGNTVEKKEKRRKKSAISWPALDPMDQELQVFFLQLHKGSHQMGHSDCSQERPTLQLHPRFILRVVG